ncbi:MAG TPA: hypothetical protein PKY59_14475 [Pyrinomonadaceae bacterium]|nr:hypothetical protein [Pyrinomonadaceae bacterium]
MKKTNLWLVTLVFLSAAVFANAQTVTAGPDFWVTDSAATYDTLALPAGYFGAGSQAYNGAVYFAGDPASGNGYDTKISRRSDVNLAAGSGSTALVVDELRLRSVAPIVVTYADGHTEKWDVYVSTSATQASTGTMTISGNASGGSFSSTLNIVPKFSFVRVSGLNLVNENGREVRNLDFGSPFVQKYLQEQARLSRDRISKGIGTEADEAVAAVCQVEPVPTEPAPTTPKSTTESAAAPAPSCGVKLNGNGTWGWNRGRFCPFPLSELALLAKHGVVPFGCR